jgi:hypothetical protein
MSVDDEIEATHIQMSKLLAVQRLMTQWNQALGKDGEARSLWQSTMNGHWYSRGIQAYTNMGTSCYCTKARKEPRG